MNYPSETSSPNLLEDLIQRNSGSLETLTREPYQLSVYAIPENLREAEMNLLKQAVQFQPELYRQITRLATAEQLKRYLAAMQEAQERTLRQMAVDSSSTTRKLEWAISQVGSRQEATTSEIATMLERNKADIQKLVSDMHRSVSRLLGWTTLLSILLSVLVCMAWQHWPT